MKKVEHSEEIKELMKQINGTEVVYQDEEEDIVGFKAIILAPPGGSHVTVKPLEDSPEEVLEKFHAIGAKNLTLEMVKKPTFCYLELPITSAESNMQTLKNIATLKTGDVCEATTIIHQSESDKLIGAFTSKKPSCPYG